MAISIGDAVLKLGVDAKSFDRDMKGIGQKLAQHRKAIGVGMVAMGGTILASATMSIKAFADMGDEVHKMSLRTGFATETLSQLRYAAGLGGASLSDVEKAAKRMASTILDAEMGLSTAVDALTLLGLTVEEFEGLSPEEQFMKFAEAISKVEDASRRSALAQDIFGKAGTQLLPMLSEGTEGLRRMMEEADKFSVVMDKEAAEAAAKLKDTMGQLGGSFDKVKIAIAEKLVPVLIPFLEKVRDTISRITEWTDAHPKLTKVLVVGGVILAGLLVTLGSLLLILPTLVAGLGMLGVAFTFALGPVGLLIAALALLGAGIALLIMNFDQVKRDTFYTWNLIRDFFIGIIQSIVGYFNQLISYFNNFWQSVVNIFQGIAGAIWNPIKNAIQWIIDYVETLKATLRSLWGMFGGRVAGGGGGAKGPKFVHPAPGYPMFKEGGIAMRPMLANIAEKVPEAVIPLDRLGQMIGGRSINVYVELDGRIIGQAVGKPLVDEIRLRTGVKI